jgi:hypothetical protein
MLKCLRAASNGSRISKSSIITSVRAAADAAGNKFRPNGLRTLLLSSIACNAEVRAAADAAGNKFRPNGLRINQLDIYILLCTAQQHIRQLQDFYFHSEGRCNQ